MKLLYVWIEEFRNIRQQGFVVDEEYKISIGVPDGDLFGFYDDQGNRVHGATPSLFRKIFYRKFSFERNNSCAGGNENSSIQSITALVGENASGKSSIDHQIIIASIYNSYDFPDKSTIELQDRLLPF